MSAGIGAGSLGVQTRRAFAQSAVRLSVGTAALDSGIPPLVGVRAGFFQRFGLDVDVQPLTSGAAMAAAVAGGTLQIAASSLMGLITAHSKGVPFQIVAPEAIYLSERPTLLLLVRKDATLRTGADLDGKTIATPALGDLQSVATFAWIDQSGGDSKTVRHVELAPAAVPAALEAGRIDAATLPEPRLSDALQAGNVRVLAKVYDAIAKRFLVSAEFAMADFIDAHREAIRRYARAQRLATIFANEHPDQTAPWLAQFARVDVDAIDHSKREVFDESIVLPHIQVVIDAAARYKVIERPFDARDLVSPVVLNLPKAA
jgi:NitT/TauT family transport system substrate-binding protein